MIFKCNYDTNTKETIIHRIWMANTYLEYMINSRVIYHRTEQQHIHPCRDISIQILPPRIDEQRGRCHHRLAWWNRSLSHRWKTWDFEQIQFGFSHLIEHRNQSPQWKFCTRLFLQEVVFYTFFRPMESHVFHEKTPLGRNQGMTGIFRLCEDACCWIHVLCKTLPSCKAAKTDFTNVFLRMEVPRSGDPVSPKKFPENRKMLGFE